MKKIVRLQKLTTLVSENFKFMFFFLGPLYNTFCTKMFNFYSNFLVINVFWSLFINAKGLFGCSNPSTMIDKINHSCLEIFEFLIFFFGHLHNTSKEKRNIIRTSDFGQKYFTFIVTFWFISARTRNSSAMSEILLCTLFFFC